MDDMVSRFDHFTRIFENSPPVFTGSETAQESHAEHVSKWLEITGELAGNRGTSGDDMHAALDHGYMSSLSLFDKGDDISAWLGQMNLAETAVRLYPGLYAAYHLAAAARFSIFLFFQDKASDYLDQMRQHIRETDYALSNQYYMLTGLLLSIQRRWDEAIPYFQLSLEHLEKCSLEEIRLYLHEPRENLMVSRLIMIADCLIKLGWNAGTREKAEYAQRASYYIDKASLVAKNQPEKYLIDLNIAELQLLLNNIEAARLKIDRLLHWKSVASRKTSVLYPAAFCILARLANLEGDQTGMIGHLSRALAESIYFPHALQEFQIVNYALAMLGSHALNRQQMEPIFKAMVVMLEAKDWYTGRGHSGSVGRFALSLWDIWQVRETDRSIRDDLYWAAYLHDIGKLKLPRSLLNKIAPLCPLERELLRLHPFFGKEILEDFGSPLIAQWISEHHQDAKGMGYPGNQPASPMGLCIAVADILEASTSSVRKYKRPKNLTEVLQELRDMGEERIPAGLIKAVEALCTIR